MTAGVPVAITGMAILSPLAWTLDSFTATLRQGTSALRRVRTPGAPGAVAALLHDFPFSDWAATNLPARTASAWDRVVQQGGLPARSGACVAAQAVQAANMSASDLAAAGLIVAGNNLVNDSQYTAANSNKPPRPSYFTNHLDTDVLGRVSELLGIRGEGCTIGGASASAALAVIAAARLITAGFLQHCLVVAPATELGPLELGALEAAGALAPDDIRTAPQQLCRPFDRNRTGFVYGHGAAAVTLEPLDQARTRGIEPAAVLAGWAQALDANRGTEPDPVRQAATMTRALEHTGAQPTAVDYLNAHATGSRAGDASEAAAIRAVFGTGTRPLVNSTKPLTGHCLAAAGLVELIATVIQLRDGFVHANPATTDPDADAPHLAGTRSVDMPIELAMSNSFGFSGINACLLLRRHPAGGPL
ncbi:beta-ketoacyl synthase N-terminal-like domain-containing protein [Micromonospora sp. CB01531]|uniref:beta-ketoacyl synthase N-terminal-like domain-containing protein n=1 Tax=Micromonospora sp. CB01531 TaxID=1718947 RepID=UPI00093B7D71|nr:beta-ketoacyl synthase N-terminal-like domain-containing protein [Micromonospora sp. CB01531]OKI48962.1 hypothetical protein A6A27_36145 [Micromonospora sp. CB01531]